MEVRRAMSTAKIGQVAQETGLSIDTIRFYEKQGLLKQSARTEGGFRLFGSGEIETLKFVRKAQELGFSLNEIRELLILRAEHVPACSHVEELLEHKLAGVEQKIEELQKLEHSLKTALQKCKRSLKTTAPGHEDCCPVLEEISRAARREGISKHEN
jgi:DNA-binding transcriptional MerR regulator